MTLHVMKKCLNPQNRDRTHNVGYLLQSLEMFGHLLPNVQKSSEHLRKSRYSEDENLTHLTQGKLACR